MAEKTMTLGNSSTTVNLNVNGALISNNYIKIPNSSTNGKGLVNEKGDSIVRDYGNGNVSIDATGHSLGLGMENTDTVSFLSGQAFVTTSGISTKGSITIGDHVTLAYDSTNQCLNFNFA